MSAAMRHIVSILEMKTNAWKGENTIHQSKVGRALTQYCLLLSAGCCQESNRIIK